MRARGVVGGLLRVDIQWVDAGGWTASTMCVKIAHVDGKLLGERIAAARNDLDLTQEHLANRVGIERTALSRIEKGERKVSAMELIALASALEVPIAWFVRDPVPAVISRRSESGPTHEMTARLDRQLELFAGDVAGLIGTAVLEVGDDVPRWAQPRTHEGSERVAREVRDHLNLGSEPVGDLASTLEQFGLYSCSVPLGDGGADAAMVEVSENVAVAVVDADARPGRRRMSMAHELGHWLFGDAFDAGASESERMINSFAVHFLAPREGIARLWREADPRSVRDRAITVAAHFRLSWSATILQLRNLGLIGDGDYRSLEGRKPLSGEFVKLGIAWTPEDADRTVLSPALASAIVEAYVDRRIAGPRVVELFRDTLGIQDLPPQRTEVAADFASL